MHAAFKRLAKAQPAEPEPDAAADPDPADPAPPADSDSTSATAAGVVDAEAGGEGRDRYDWGVGLRPEEKRRLDFEGKTYLAPLTTVGNLPFRRSLLPRSVSLPSSLPRSLPLSSLPPSFLPVSLLPPSLPLSILSFIHPSFPSPPFIRGRPAVDLPIYLSIPPSFSTSETSACI